MPDPPAYVPTDAVPTLATARDKKTMALLEFNTWRNTIGDVWTKDCEATLGMETLRWVDPRRWAGGTVDHPAQTPFTTDAVERLAADQPHWLFLAGHNYVKTDHNKIKGHESYPDLRFFSDRIEFRAESGSAAKTFPKASMGLDDRLELIMLGGCDVFTNTSTLKRLQVLFGDGERRPLILGCRYRTGSDVVRAILGYTVKDKSNRDVVPANWLPWEKGFFGRLEGKAIDEATLIDAWMQSAKYGWGGNDFKRVTIPSRETFCAFDAQHRVWKLVKNAAGVVEIVTEQT